MRHKITKKTNFANALCFRASFTSYFMGWIRDTKTLLLKDIRLELRQAYALSGVLLYVLSTSFVVYSALGQEVGPAIWAALYWVIVLFASVNAVAKSFVQEPTARQLYYYSLTSPLAIILSKTIYNTGLLLLISTLSYFVFALVMGSPVQDYGLFALLLFLGSLGFAISFTFISAISAKAKQSATMMAILSFPVILPMLMTLMRLSKISLRLMQDTAYYKDIVILLCIDLILLSLALLLFPFLWRD